MAECFKVKINSNRCKGCQLCVVHCPVKHLKMSEKFNRRGIPYAKEKENSKCIGCGVCFQICPETCIEIFQVK